MRAVSLHASYRSGVVTALIGGAVMFLSYRIYLRYLGYEQYGLWLMLATVLSVIQLGSIGLGPALTRLVAQRHGTETEDPTQRYLATSVFLVSGFGVILGCLLIAGGHTLARLLNLSSTPSLTFLKLLPAIVALSLYAVVVDLFAAAVSGLGRIDSVNYAQLIGQCSGAMVSITLLHLKVGIPSLLWGSAASLVLLHAQAIFRVSQLSPFHFHQGLLCSRSEIRKLLGFGGWVAATTLVNASIGPLTRVLLARFAGLAAIPDYDLALSACYKLRAVWECALRALLPEVSRLCSRTDGAASPELSVTYWHAVRLLAVGSTPVYAFVFFLASPILHFWLGSVTGNGVATLRILLVATFVNLQAVTPYYLLIGMGRIWHCFAASAAMAFVCIACAAVVIRFSGTLTAPNASTGFLIGTSVLTLYLSWRGRKELLAVQHA